MSTTIKAEIAFGVQIPDELAEWLECECDAPAPRPHPSSPSRRISLERPPAGVEFRWRGEERYWIVEASIIGIVDHWDTPSGGRPLQAGMFDPVTIEIYTTMLAAAFALADQPLPCLAQWYILTDVS
jgi:hypothetical protein